MSSNHQPISQPFDFQVLFEAAPGSFLALLPDSPRFTIISVSNAFLEMTFTRRDDMIGRGVFEVFPDNTNGPRASALQDLRNSLETVIRQRQADRMPIQKYAIRGSASGDDQSEERYWRQLNLPVFRANGDLAYIIHQVEDVTHERQRDAVLRESENLNRRILQNSADWITVLDPQAKILKINAAGLCALELADPDEARNREWVSLWTTKDRPAVEAALRDASEGDCGRFVSSLRMPSGDERWWEVLVTSLLDEAGRPERLVSIARDITEPRRTMAELRAARKRLEANLAAVEVATWTWDIQRDEVTPDRNLSRLFGLPDNAPLSLEAFLQPIHPEDRERVTAAFRQAVETKDFSEVEYRVRQPENGVRWIIARGLMETDDAGQPCSLAGIIVDITDRKQAEMELQAHATALRHADRRKDEFLAMLAHELRNPLNVMRSALEVIQHGNPHSDAYHRALSVANRQIQQQARLVDDLLDASRVRWERLVLRRHWVDLAQLLHETTEDFRPDAVRAGLTLSLELPGEPVWVFGDPVRLAQIWINLLSNAVKFTSPGGKITARLGIDPAARQAIASVRDTGAGISPNLLPNIFDSFMQGEQNLARSRGGLGLGLALVKGLTELHGGQVYANSEGEGCGSEFVVRLPLAPPKPEPEPESPARRQPARSLRILVVEDNPDAAETLRDLLELWGHQAWVSHSGTEGVDVARALEPDVVLCDIGLPGLDGYEVARQLRRDPHLAGVRLIALSGYGYASDEQRVRQAGFEEHLVKPVDPARLQSLLDRD